MITLEKLKIFKRYNDIDSFGRKSSDIEKQIMSDEEWWLIETLLQDATVIVRNLGSEERTAQAVRRLQENSENQEVIEEIKKLAR